MKVVEGKCLKCGSPLGPDSRQGFCVICLFLAAAVPTTEKLQPPPVDESREAASSAKPGATDARNRFGDYELLKEVGRGGMGIVYKARQVSLGRLVAVKLLRFGPLAGDEFVKRLRVEATAAGCLRHTNIVAIHEVGIHHDQHYLVMDYVAGSNLAMLAGNQPLPPQRAAQLSKTIAEAIHYAHERGVLHRDLKPSNILIEGEDHPRITDFGLAKRLKNIQESEVTEPASGKKISSAMSNDPDVFSDLPSFTLTGQIIGSPNYMPPEQAAANHGQIGRPSDVYSIGAILFQLLTGRPPFLAETISATIHQVLESEPPSPRLLNPRVPADLETICLKCLEKESEQRYATARGLAEELGRFLSGDPILARPIGAPQKLWRWCRKNAAVASLIGATLALLLTVAIGSPIAAYQIHRARQDTEQHRQRAVNGEAEAKKQLYIGKMNLVQAAWEANNFVRLTELVDETREFPGRGFEWLFWRRQLHLAFMRLRGHFGRVSAVAFSPNGDLLVTASEDRTAIVWDAANGEQRANLTGHNGRVHSAAWFPDNLRVATASDDHTIKVWNAHDGATLNTLQPNHGRLAGVAVSRDGQWLASANQDGTASIWSTADWRETIVLRGHTNEVWSVDFSPDGRFLATGGADHTARIWDLADAGSVKIFEGHQWEVRSAVFSPDGSRIVTASADYWAIVWEVASSRKLHMLPGHTDIIMSAAFSRDGQWIATGSKDWAAKLWRARDAREVRTFSGHDDQVFAVAFSPDGRRLATGSRDMFARIWELQQELKSLRLDPHRAQVGSIKFSPNGQLIATSSSDGTIRISEASTGRQRFLLKTPEMWLPSVVFSPDGRLIAWAGNEVPAKIWDLSGPTELPAFGEPSEKISSVAFSPDSQWLATGHRFGVIKIWNVATGKEQRSISAHGLAVSSIAFFSDGKRIVSGSRDELIKVWDTASGRELLSMKGHGDSVLSVAVSKDGQRIVSGSEDRTAKVWKADTGREVMTLRAHAATVCSVAFSPDGTRIVSGSEDRTARLWDASTGGQFLTIPAASAVVRAVAFSSDGRRIGVASDDGTSTVWDAASTEQLAQWEVQEEKARQRVARLQRERLEAAEKQRAARARDPGAIKDWLMLAPFVYSITESGREALDEEICARESELRPAAGDRVIVGDKELTWRSVRLSDDFIDFDKILGHAPERSVAYAVAYIHSAARQEPLRLLVGSDDMAKVYLNGKQVYQSRYQRSYREDEDVIEDVALNAGTNVLIFKIVNVNADWMASLRITDRQGNPPTGIKVTTP